MASEPPHVNIKDKYELVKKIGTGSYGQAWLAFPVGSQSNLKVHKKHCVLKRLDLAASSDSPTQNGLETAEREASVLSTLQHPNIVTYIESFRSNDGFFNIVMAYCEGGDLSRKLKEKKLKGHRLSEDQIIEWFVQISMALKVGASARLSPVIFLSRLVYAR